jgi:phosphorylcholine metabolism protein LicD
MAGDKKNCIQLTLLYTKIMELLKNCNIQLILFYGSLLGYYRDNNFIDGDDDIDVIISNNDYDILLRYLYTNMDSNIKFGIKNGNIIQLYYNNIGPFDIYKFINYDDNILIKQDGNLLFNKQHIFPLKKILFNNFNIFIPNNSEKIILDTYGSNWKIPQIKGVDYHWDKINNVKKLSKYSFISLVNP